MNELLRINVNSLVVEMPVEYDSNIIFPIIIKHKISKEYKVVVSRSKDGLLTKSKGIFSKKVISYKEFRSDYLNRIMLLEEVPYIKKQTTLLAKIISNYQDISYLILSLLTLLSLCLLKDEFAITFLSIIYFTGICLCTAYYNSEKNGDSNIITLLCKSNTKSDCSKLKGIKIFGFSFSLLGLFFFISCFLISVFIEVTYIVLLISVIGFFVISYSLYVQLIKVRVRCLFCLILIGLYFLSFPFVYINLIPGFYLEKELISIIVLLTTCIGVLMIEQNNLRNKQLISYASSFNEIMSRWDTLRSIRSNTIDNINYESISIGNKNSNLKIILHVQINCKHCNVALRELLNLIYLNNNLLLTIRFHASDSKQAVIYISKVMEAAENNNIEGIYNLYEDLKRMKSIDSESSAKYEKEATEHLKFNLKSKIRFFPFLLVNGQEILNYFHYDNIKIALAKQSTSTSRSE